MNYLAKLGIPQRMIWGGYFLLVGVVFVVGDYLYTAYLYTLIAPIVVLESARGFKLALYEIRVAIF